MKVGGVISYQFREDDFRFRPRWSTTPEYRVAGDEVGENAIE